METRQPWKRTSLRFQRRMHLDIHVPTLNDAPLNGSSLGVRRSRTARALCRQQGARTCTIVNSIDLN